MAATGDDGRIEPGGGSAARVPVEVVSGVGEGREDEDLAVAGVDRVSRFALDKLLELAELGVVLGGHFAHLPQ